MRQDIVLQEICMSFGDLTVLHNLNVTIPQGEITCIMGPSGVGKTTLLHILLGLIKPDRGSIQGIDKKTMAAVFQENRLCEHFDAIENVKLALTEKLDIVRIQQEFSKVQLTEYENKPVQKLSGGMKRRVAIVRAVLANADIMILDEPMKGLDFDLKAKVLRYLKEATEGKTVIMVTHDVNEVSILGANVIEIH